MSEHTLPTINPTLLPAGRVVTGQNQETGAIQEIIIDGQCQLSVYDPALQTPEVQARFAGFDPPRMATLGLRASGIDWQTTKAILHNPESPVEFDERLHNPLFALNAVGYCFRQGLLRSQVMPGGHGNLGIGPFTASEKLTLALATQGKVNQHDERTLKALRRLDQEYTETEPNLLSLLTKAMATDLREIREPYEGIVYASPERWEPTASPDLAAEPEPAPSISSREEIPIPPAEPPTLAPKPKPVLASEPETVVEPLGRAVGPPGMPRGSLRTPPYLKTEAAFEVAVQRLFQVEQPARHTVGFRGAEITLNYRDELPATLGAIATQHAFGLTKEQIFGLDISPQQEEAFWRMRAHFGLNASEQRAEWMPGLLFERNYVEDVNLANYLPNQGITEYQEHLVELLSRTNHSAIMAELGLSSRQIKMDILHLCKAFESSHMARLMWAATLSKYLPGLEQLKP